MNILGYLQVILSVTLFIYLCFVSYYKRKEQNIEDQINNWKKGLKKETLKVVEDKHKVLEKSYTTIIVRQEEMIQTHTNLIQKYNETLNYFLKNDKEHTLKNTESANSNKVEDRYKILEKQCIKVIDRQEEMIHTHTNLIQKYNETLNHFLKMIEQRILKNTKNTNSNKVEDKHKVLKKNSKPVLQSCKNNQKSKNNQEIKEEAA